MKHFIDPIFIKELQRIQNSFKTFPSINIDLPLSQIVRDAQRHKLILKSALDNAVGNLQIDKGFIRQMQRTAANQAKTINNFPDFSHIAKIVEDARVNALPFLKTINHLYGNLENIRETSVPLSFGESLQHVQQEYEISIAEGKKDIVEFSQQIESKTTAAPKGFLSAESITNLIFALILFLVSQHSANVSEQKLTSQIQHLEQLITELPQTLMPLHDDSIYYVAIKFVNLRQKPNRKSTVLEVLCPNLKVKLLFRKGKWIQVQYYDHVSNEFKTGWVYKKNLKILNPKRPGQKAF